MKALGQTGCGNALYETFRILVTIKKQTAVALQKIDDVLLFVILESFENVFELQMFSLAEDNC